MIAVFAKLLAFLPTAWEIIKKVIPFMKTHQPLSVFCDDIKHVYCFKEHMVIPVSKVLDDSLAKQINKERRRGEVLILDLSALKVFNTETYEVLRTNIKNMILKNNIRCFVIFPKIKLNDLYDEISDLIYDKNCKSINIKKDERKKRKVKKLI